MFTLIQTSSLNQNFKGLKLIGVDLTELEVFYVTINIAVGALLSTGSIFVMYYDINHN